MSNHDLDRPVRKVLVLLGVLVTPLPAMGQEPLRTEAEDTWFITRSSTVTLKSAPPSTANYPVLQLEPGQPLLLGSFESGDRSG